MIQNSRLRFAFRFRHGNVPLLALLLARFALPAAAQVINQANPSAAAPGQTISLTVSGADRALAANNIINVIQNGAVVAQVPARSVAPLSGTTLAQLNVVLPAAIAPTTRGLKISGGLSLQIGATGAAGAVRPFVFQSLPSLLAVTPSGASILDFAPVVIRQGGGTMVQITGQFTSFRQGVTKASFGPGIQVGGAPAGTPGPLTVLSPTAAVAVLSAAPTAPLGAADLSLATGREQLTRAASLTIIAPTQATLNLSLNTTLVTLENFGQSAQVIASVNAFDHNGNRVANPAVALSVTPSLGVTTQGSVIIFTIPGKYTITAAGTIDGQPLSASTQAGVGGVTPAPNAGGGLTSKEFNSLGRFKTALDSLVKAVQTGDNSGVLANAALLKGEIGGTDYPSLVKSHLLGTAADPNHDLIVGDSSFAGNTLHFQTHAQLPLAQQANDDTFQVSLNSVNAELDRAIAVLNGLPANPTQADVNRVSAEVNQLVGLLDALTGTSPSIRGVYDSVPLLQTLLAQKLPALSQALEQYTILLLRGNGYNVSAKSHPPLHDGVYRPGRDRASVQQIQFGALFGFMTAQLGVLGDVMYSMYAPAIGDLQSMYWVFYMANHFPHDCIPNVFCPLSVTGTSAGLDTCENVVSIHGGVTAIFGMGFDSNGNNEVELHGSKSISPLVGCLDGIAGLGLGGLPTLSPLNWYNTYQSIQSAWASCLAVVRAQGGTFDDLKPGDPRLSGAGIGIDCNEGFTDDSSEVDVAGFNSQKRGTFDFAAFIVVRNLTTGYQEIRVVTQF